MAASVGLSPGAEDNELATWLARTIEESVADATTRRDFFAMRAAVAIVALEPGTTPNAPMGRSAVTLRFDHGHLTIHDGVVGVPDMTLCGDREHLLRLAALPISRTFGLPLPRRGASDPLRRTLREIAQGSLKVYGLAGHPRLFVRLLRLLSRVRA